MERKLWKKGKRKFAKKGSLFLVMLLMLTSATACGTKKNNSSLETNDGESILQKAQAIDMPEVSWQTEAKQGEVVKDVMKAVITLNETTANIEGSGVTADGNKVTITEAGEYELSGNLHGQLVIDTDSEENVKLIFNGVKITNENSAAIYVISSPGKTILHCQKGSVNCIVDGENYTELNEEDEPNAAIFAKDDLKISGSGELYVTGNYGKGISCKDDLEIKNVSVYVDALDDAIRGKDSVEIESAFLYLLAGGDGLRSSNEIDEGEGNITIVDSECYITAYLDGIQAILDLSVTNCTMGITSGQGYTGGETSNTETESASSDIRMNGATLTTYLAGGPGGHGGGPGGQGGPGGMTGGPGGMSEGNSNVYTDSCKGLKAGGNLTVTGGEYTINSYDDAFHCGSTLAVNGGNYVISTGDDGFHSDDVLTIEDGTIEITTSYEGLEASKIHYNGGTTRLVASDDGINAAGGNDASGMEGKWGDQFSSDGTSLVELNGGYLVMDASGDGLDSNGDLMICGGTYIVYGPTNDGNGALDYNGTCKHSGGTVLAVGSSGMAQSLTSDFGVLAFTCGMNADTILSIQDEAGNIIISFAAPKSYNCVVLASEGLQSGETYSVYADGEYSEDAIDGVYTNGSYSEGELLGSLEAN